MELQEGTGCFYWAFMAFFFVLGLVTFPFGIAIWIIQFFIFVKTKRVGDD